MKPTQQPNRLTQNKSTYFVKSSILVFTLGMSLILLTNTCKNKPKEQDTELHETKQSSKQLTPPKKLPVKLLPVNYRILDEITGDLNKDNISDKILVLVHKTEPKESEVLDPERETPPRKLIIFLAKDGEYKQVIVSNSAIMCRECGGMMGDPYQSIKIERNTFVISHFGGSSEKWGYDHRFQLRSGKWQMTGITKTEYDSLTGIEEIIDTNLLTGDSILTKTDRKNMKTSKRSKSKPTLRYLKDFKV